MYLIGLNINIYNKKKENIIEVIPKSNKNIPSKL